MLRSGMSEGANQSYESARCVLAASSLSALDDQEVSRRPLIGAIAAGTGATRGVRGARAGKITSLMACARMLGVSLRADAVREQRRLVQLSASALRLLGGEPREFAAHRALQRGIAPPRVPLHEAERELGVGVSSALIVSSSARSGRSTACSAASRLRFAATVSPMQPSGLYSARSVRATSRPSLLSHASPPGTTGAAA